MSMLDRLGFTQKPEPTLEKVVAGDSSAMAEPEAKALAQKEKEVEKDEAAKAAVSTSVVAGMAF
jgi:hypothetical protein